LSPEGALSNEDVEVLERSTVFQGYFRVDRYRLRHRLFAGGWSELFQREVFERGHAVAIVLYDPDRDRLLLIEQFRIGALAAAGTPEVDVAISPWMLEIVAGIIEPDESPDVVVRREAVEEAGCEILDLIRVCSFLVTPGVSSETITLYCGRVRAPDGDSIRGLAHEHEDIRVLSVPTEDVFGWLDQGRIVNATALVGLYWFRTNREKLRARWAAAG
jgi:ADP-ribose pyrophosphatase